MTFRVSLLAASVVAIMAGPALGQSQATPPLADVARQAEAAKATVKKAKKTYTNSDLGKDPRGEPAPAAAAPAPATGVVSKTADKAVQAEATVAPGAAKAESETVAKESEETWRNRANAVRQQIDQVQNRLAGLSTPNALTTENPTLKAHNDNELANARTGLEALRKQWARLETSAREKKIPMAWIEPLPTFQQ